LNSVNFEFKSKEWGAQRRAAWQVAEASHIREGMDMQTGMDIERNFAALAARDRRADGRFVYAVMTTGVYCRPSCGARRPRAENVRFYADGAAAMAAGYRACKRCRPNGVGDGEANEAMVAAACRRMAAAERAPLLAASAAEAGLSAFHFHRIFRAATGVTPRAFYEARRSERARRALAAAESVTAAIYEAGYESSSRFYAAAPGRLGMKVGIFRAGGPGERIEFATAACALGFVLVARTAVGICAISLGQDAGELQAGFAGRFAQAVLVEDGGLGEEVRAVVAMIEAPGTGISLSLDIRGTAFQQRVWAALRRIPAGRTASYTGIARDLGKPRAVRAVAGACAANELAVAIPCHRVVRADGGLAGYRWGLALKRRLLDVERDG
jgi:AraC family transcriptional regulator of adaptative response/methylated-DNA-[protein]-cysteine methyltransferase